MPDLPDAQNDWESISQNVTIDLENVIITSITDYVQEPLINVCEAVSAAKVAALGEAKISELKCSKDGTRRVSSFSCVRKAQFIGHT